MSKKQSQNFLQGAMILTAAALLVKVIGALYKIPLTNILGGTGMAHFMTAYQIFTPIYALSMAGFPVAVSKLTSEYSAKGRIGDVKRLFRISTVLFLLTGTLGMCLLYFGAPTFAGLVGNPDAVLAIRLMAPAIFFCCVMASFRGYAQGLGNMTTTAVSQLVEAVAKLVLGIALAYMFLQLGLRQYAASGAILGQVVANSEQAHNKVLALGAAGGILGVTLSTAVGALYLCLHHSRSKSLPTTESRSQAPQTPSGKLLKSLLLIALPVCMGSLAAHLTTVADLASVMNRLAVAIATDGQAVRELYAGLLPVGIADADIPVFLYGSYTGLAVSIFNLVPALTMALGVSALPAVASAWALHQKEHASQQIRSVIKITTLLAVPAGLGISALSHPILSLLFSARQQEAAVAAPLLQIMGISAILVALNTPITSILQAVGKAHVPVFFMLIGAAVKLGINTILIARPQINIGGAPWGTLFCYAIILAGNLLYLKKHTGISLKVGTIFLKPLICGILCALSAHTSYELLARVLSPRFSTVLAILIGGGVYAIFVLFLKLITRNEALMLPNGKKVAKILEKLSFLG